MKLLLEFVSEAGAPLTAVQVMSVYGSLNETVQFTCTGFEPGT